MRWFVLRRIFWIGVVFPLAAPFYVVGGALKGAGFGILAWLDDRDDAINDLLRLEEKR